MWQTAAGTGSLRAGEAAASAVSLQGRRTTRSAASWRVRHWSQDVRDNTGFYPGDEDQLLDTQQVHTVTACCRHADTVSVLGENPQGSDRTLKVLPEHGVPSGHSHVAGATSVPAGVTALGAAPAAALGSPRQGSRHAENAP